MALILALAVAVVMFPRLRSSQFGLLDDGVTLAVAQILTASASEGDLGLAWRLEAERGRFRPLYWVYNTILYTVSRHNPFGYFLANALALLATALAVAGTVALVTGDYLASLAAGLAYTLSPPVIEAYYTLSKPEVPLTLWLGLSLCCWAGARINVVCAPRRSRSLLALSALFLIAAYLTKETAQALLVVSGLWVMVQWATRRAMRDRSPESLDRWYFVINLACVALFWISREAGGTASIGAGADSRQYAVGGPVLVSAAVGHLMWYVRDFPFLLPLWAFLWWRESQRWRRDPWLAVISPLWILSWTVIMLPWHSLHEYYLLPATLGASLIVGPGVASVLRSLRDRRLAVRVPASVLGGALLIAGLVVLGNMITTARVQLAIDATNARLVDFLAHAVPREGIVLVNIPAPNEYMDELAIHLHTLKGRHDVTVEYAGKRHVPWMEGVVVVTPVLRNQPAPSVRIAVSEADARRVGTEWQDQSAGKAHLVFRHSKRVPLLIAQIQQPLCSLLAPEGIAQVFFCPRSGRLLDTRRFEYGWEVYQLL